MEWDYFISHASEDKQLVATPLAHYLKTADFDVWYDEFSLKVVDSLMQSINNGLGKSRYGVVVLSPSFFEKKWPQRELGGLFALETTAEPRILPVWHQVTASGVAEYSPMLADRKAADTQRGLQYVAEQLVKASFPERVARLPLSSVKGTDDEALATAKQAFRSILDRTTSVNDLYLYLSGFPALLHGVLGYYPEVIPGFKLSGPIRCDFAELVPHGVTGPVEVLFVLLGPALYDHAFLNDLIKDLKRSLGKPTLLRRHPANDFLGAPYFGEYPLLEELATAIREYVKSDNIHWERPDTWSFKFIVLSGRRGLVPLEERKRLAEGSGLRIDIASYDRLLDDRRSIYR